MQAGHRPDPRMFLWGVARRSQSLTPQVRRQMPALKSIRPNSLLGGLAEGFLRETPPTVRPQMRLPGAGREIPVTPFERPLEAGEVPGLLRIFAPHPKRSGPRIFVPVRRPPVRVRPGIGFIRPVFAGPRARSPVVFGRPPVGVMQQRRRFFG